MLRDTGDAAFWNRIARKYANDAIKDMAGYDRTIERSRALLHGAEAVLEIGCGTGTSALRIAPVVGRMVGTDVAAEMVAIAREKAAAQACTNVDFAVAAADRTPGTAGSFDAVLAFNVLHLVADRAAALRHARHLLKPGGLFVSKTPCLSEMSPLLRLAVPVAQAFGKAPHVSFFAARDLASEIECAGFTIIEQARHGSGRKDPRIFILARAAGPVTAQAGRRDGASREVHDSRAVED